MFDLADLITLPGSGQGACSGASRRAAPNETFPERNTSTAAPTARNQNTRHVIEACAMAGDNVALAMSDGELCHAKLSQMRAATTAKLLPTEEQRWPAWTSWPSRHGKVDSLQYDPAHDALVTIEQATTAAGDQAFLGRYHRKAGLANKEREGDKKGETGNGASSATKSWVGCSVPLATRHAKVAVCASRGWAAVCTGSTVNLWAVARPGLEPLNARRGASRLRQAPVGFEHALSVDLAELVGVKGGTSKEGGAKHIALHGNLLALATDHAVFLIHLSFDVKGEATGRVNGINAPTTPSARGAATQSPKVESPQMHSRVSSPRDKPAASLQGPPIAPKSDSKEPPKDAASRGGPSGTGKGLAGVDEGDEGGKVKPERRDGIVERAVSEADDLVICVLHPAGEGDGRESDGSAQPPPLLRAFDDDWEAFRARGGYLEEPPELANASLGTEIFPVSLPVNGNSAVLDRVGGCEVVLARRVGPGEVVKQLHLLPVSQRGYNSDSAEQGESDRPVSHSCRFVLLTSKGATVCLVCATRSTPVGRPEYQALVGAPSPGAISSSLPPSPSSTPSGRHWVGHVGGKRQPAGSRPCSDLDAGAIEGVAAAGNNSGDSQQFHVYLRRSCRFVNELVLASINSALMFVLTVEGVEVWTFPSDKLPVAIGIPENWLDEHAFGGGGTPPFSSPGPSPRPCLLHVQQLEIDGVLPRSPTSCMVSLGGAAPSLLLFPSPPTNQGASLAFLAQQCRRRLRSPVPADGAMATGFPASRKPPVPSNPFSAWQPEGDSTKNVEQECWQHKVAAWRNGFCGLGRYGASPLALFLRLRTPAEAFRRLAAAEGCATRPFSTAVSTMFESAAEGLHGALTAEAATAWHSAVCSEGGLAAIGLAGRAGTFAGSAVGASAVKRAEIENILAGLATCWRLQRVAARCASLLGRLLLERAMSTGEDGEADSCLAYTRACSWLLDSEGSVVKSFARLRDVAAYVSAVVGGEVERPAAAPSFVSLDGDEDERSDVTTGEVYSPDLGELLPTAMYESYLLPSLGVRDTSESLFPPIFAKDEQPSSLDDVLSGLVSYLHGRDMRRLSRRPALHGVGETRRGSTPLSTAVVYANRIPWTSCPVALSQALLALDEQDKAWAESTSSNMSSIGSSDSGSASLPSGKASPDVAKRSKPVSKAGDDAEHPEHHPRRDAFLDNRDGAKRESALSPAQEWVSVARAILLGYSESMESGAGSATFFGHPAAPRSGVSALVADSRVLQLACERHPTLVAPMKAGAGPLARDLLAGGRAQPVVSALVNLTSYQGRGEAPFGPHRARELLQLTEDCFSPTIDPLHALRSFGISGRQIAARLDSLRRSSLDLSGAPGFPAEARHCDGEAREQSTSDAVDSRLDRRENKALLAAAREFLSRRCSASLATAGPSARHQERLSQALGAPEVWQASFARNRALDRAILRYLIGAHLDDLRALENSTAGNPKVARRTPTTVGWWGRGLTRTASARVRNRRDGGECSWADVIVPLLSGQVSRGRGGPADEHVDAILCLIREISWRAGRAGSTGSGRSMSHEEAEEVVTEAKRRLPVSEAASASASNLIDYDEHRHVDDDTQPWGAGGEGMKVRRAPWPWGPRTVPASAVGAVLALAAALPPAGKLLAGLDVMLQVGAEVIAAAKAEAAASAGAVAAASGSAGKGAARGGLASASPKNAAAKNAGEAHASVEEVSRAAERALLLYTSEYCGKDPDKWASVTEHVRNTRTSDGEGHEGGGLTWGEGVDDGGQKLVRALLRRCGEKLGGEALVRALPTSLDLMDCLDEVERSLLND